MNVSLTAKPGASRRTKTKIGSHGPVFVQETPEPQTVQFQPDGSLWLRFSAPDGWGGWLPVEDIEVTPW